MTTATDTQATNQQELDQLITICEQRAATYNLLARLYQVEVDQPLLDELKARTFPTGTGNEAVDKGYGLLVKFMSNLWENSLLDLAIDYVRVFIGHGMDMYSAAYPYESVYTSKKRLLMQEARDEVLALYHGAGVIKQDSWTESEDHIALELEFMQIQATRTATALRLGNEDEAVQLLRAQRNFLDDHLCAWVPMMTTDMKKLAKTDLYQGLAWLTEGYLDEDLAFLGELLGDEACAAMDAEQDEILAAAKADAEAGADADTE